MGRSHHWPSRRLFSPSSRVAALLILLASVPAAAGSSRRMAIPTFDVRIATARPDSAQVVVAIAGMYCSSCEQTIRAMLMRTNGVRAVAVSAKTGRAVVTYDPTKTTPGTILSVVKRLGYEASLARS